MSKIFGVTTVAEGVETLEQFEVLPGLGCDQSQGYLHARPVTRDEIEQLMREGQGSLLLPADAADAAGGGTQPPDAEEVGGLLPGEGDGRAQ